MIPDPLTGEDAHDVVQAGPRAAPALRDHGEVAVVLDHHRATERAGHRARQVVVVLEDAREEHATARRVHGARAAHARGQQLGASDPGVGQGGADRAADDRQPLLARELAHAFGHDLPAQIGDGGADLHLADVYAEHVARIGPERERARRAAASPALGRDLFDPAQGQQVVGDGVDGGP
jgi:hypothetical protein